MAILLPRSIDLNAAASGMATSIYDRVALGIEHGLDVPLSGSDVLISYLPMVRQSL